IETRERQAETVHQGGDLDLTYEELKLSKPCRSRSNQMDLDLTYEELKLSRWPTMKASN
ncbi:hypothetical protein CathTA2_0075, partial [Caldalkalibacillus thermarum TA2.A1]